MCFLGNIIFANVTGLSGNTALFSLWIFNQNFQSVLTEICEHTINTSWSCLSSVMMIVFWSCVFLREMASHGPVCYLKCLTSMIQWKPSCTGEISTSDFCESFWATDILASNQIGHYHIKTFLSFSYSVKASFDSTEPFLNIWKGSKKIS